MPRGDPGSRDLAGVFPGPVFDIIDQAQQTRETGLERCGSIVAPGIDGGEDIENIVDRPGCWRGFAVEDDVPEGEPQGETMLAGRAPENID